MNKKILGCWLGVIGLVGLSACQSTAQPPVQAPPLQDVTLMLDWVPNTNHTGIFVAQDQGYFEEMGLNVTIIQPGEVYAEQAVSSGAAEFGISFQEQLTIARADDIPLVSIAAIIQHNTSAFAARGELGVSSPQDWEGLRYGAFGSPFEEPTLRVLMECAGGEFDQLDVVDTGFADPLILLAEDQIDLAWIFYAWQGIQAQQQGIALDLVHLSDWYECIPDYYTPILITNESMIKQHPETVEALVGAIALGYTYAIENPDAAAGILLKAVPELDESLVRASQAWISDQYQADAGRWGEQQLKVWEDYTAWMVENGIIDTSIDAQMAFSNAFLP